MKERGCYEGHANVDERHEVYEEQRGCYEYNENSGAVRSIVFIVVLNRRIASEFGSCIKSTKQIVTFKVYW